MNLSTRRDFLRSTLLGTAMSGTVPAFLASAIDALQAEAAGQANPLTGKDAPVLVVIQLAGGNDGLNTLIPYSNDHYRRARPKLGIPAERVLKLDDNVGLHPSLVGMKELFDAGNLGIVQAVGYPNPNRSHFRSTEIWQTASDANRVEKYGWIGRYFDHACAGADPTVGIAIGPQAPQSFSARIPKGVSLQDPKGYRFADSEIDESVSNDGSMSGSKAYRAMSQLDFGEVSGASIDSLGGSSQVPDGLSPIDYLERTALDAQISSDLIRKITSKSLIKAEYPANRLASQLKLVSQLIAGGLSSRIYYASHGGFDTHTNQLATHDRLMREVGDSLRTFIDDLKAQGNLDRVMVMMFSEFGRRVSENASQGTDHGAAAPMFLLGSRIKPGIQGAFPSLAPEDLFNGDIRFKIDFRGVYASVLEQWLKTNSAAILGRQFSKLNVVS